MLIEQLSLQSGVSVSRLRAIAGTASKRYKVYTIPKRSGGRRRIEHPSRELKAIQRWLISTVFMQFPIHPSATAYKQGSGIKSNAAEHKKTRYTSRYDFLGFFPSFRQEQIERFFEIFKKEMGLTEDDIQFIGKIACRHGRLTIGAPSSPILTNIMMFAFDEMFARYCEGNDLIFTRYADDLFISANSPRQIMHIENEIRRINRAIDYLSLRINHQKTAHLSRKHRRMITGVTITPEGELSVGRRRKREIRTLIHLWLTGQSSALDFEYLRGLVAFAKDIEPDLEGKLSAKFGDKAIQALLHDPNGAEYREMA